MVCHAKACCKISEPDHESFYDDICTYVVISICSRELQTYVRICGAYLRSIRCNIAERICLICMPEAQGLQAQGLRAQGLRAYISGESLLLLLQVICITSGTLKIP